MDPKNVFVRRIASYKALSPDDISLLESACDGIRAVPKNELLCREESISTHATILLDGLACRFSRNLQGQRLITSFILPGDGCNLMLPPIRMTDAVGALTDCKVAEIPNDVLARLWQRPSIAAALHIAAAVEDATLRSWLFNIGRRRATDRFAHLMLKLHHRLMVVGRAGPQSFEFPISQSDCADALGLSLVHMNKSYQQIRRLGAMTWKHGIVRISDVDTLRAKYEVDLGYLNPTEPDEPERAREGFRLQQNLGLTRCA